jgi:hypothetical protein
VEVRACYVQIDVTISTISSGCRCMTNRYAGCGQHVKKISLLNYIGKGYTAIVEALTVRLATPWVVMLTCKAPCLNIPCCNNLHLPSVREQRKNALSLA